MKTVKWVVVMVEGKTISECFQFENEKEAREEYKEIEKRMDRNENDIAIEKLEEDSKILMIIARGGMIEKIKGFQTMEDLKIETENISFNRQTDDVKLIQVS